MDLKGLIVSSDEILEKSKIKNYIKFVIIRTGFTDFDKNKTKRIDSKFKYNYDLAKKYDLKILFYYKSCASTIEDAKNEIKYITDLIKDKIFDYKIIIEFEDDHSTIIYHPFSQKNISKDSLINIVNFEIDELNKYGYDVIIKTYENWYKDIFREKIKNVKYFLDDNKEIFDDIIYIQNGIVINNFKCNKVNIELSVKENNLLLKTKRYIVAGCKFIKRKIGKFK